MIHLVQVIKTNGTHNKFVDNNKSSQGFVHTALMCFFTAFKCDLLVFSLKENLIFRIFPFYFLQFILYGFFGWPLIWSNLLKLGENGLEIFLYLKFRLLYAGQLDLKNILLQNSWEKKLKLLGKNNVNCDDDHHLYTEKYGQIICSVSFKDSFFLF